MKQLKQLLLALPAVFNVIPGLLVIKTGIGTPPDGMDGLFGGVIIAFGSFALLLLWTNKYRVQRYPAKKVNFAAIVLMIACLLLIFAYVGLYKVCVVSYAENAKCYYPLILFGDLARFVKEAGGRYDALQPDNAGPFQINKELQQPANVVSLHLTTVLLLLVYSGIFTCLTLAFGLVAFHRLNI